MNRVEINTRNTRHIFAVNSINHINIEKDCSSGNKRLFLTINTTPFFVACGEENVKNATDELHEVFEELERFIFEPTNFSKMVINISEEKTMIEPAYAIVELQCEHGQTHHKQCRNPRIIYSCSHTTDLYTIKLVDNGQDDETSKRMAKALLVDEIGKEHDIEYAKIVERNDGVYKTSYIRDDFE